MSDLSATDMHRPNFGYLSIDEERRQNPRGPRRTFFASAAALAAVLIAVVVLLVVGLGTNGRAVSDGRPIVPPGGPYLQDLSQKPTPKWSVDSRTLLGTTQNYLMTLRASRGGMTIFGQGSTVAAVDTETGKPLWPKPSPLEKAYTCAIARWGAVMCTSSSGGDAQGAGSYVIKQVSILDRANGAVLRTIPVEPMTGVTYLYAIGDSFLLYQKESGMTGQTKLTAFSPGGDVWWTKQFAGSTGSVVYGESAGLLLVDTGDKTVLLAAADGRTLFDSATIDKRERSSRPTVTLNALGYTVYFRSELKFYDQSGNERAKLSDGWTTTATSSTSGEITSKSGSANCSKVVVTHLDRDKPALGVADPVTGKLVWQKQTSDDKLFSTTKCVGNRILVTESGGSKQNTLVYDLNSGRQTATIQYTGGLFTTGYEGSDGSRAFYAPMGKTASAYDLTTGQQIWTISEPVESWYYGDDGALYGRLDEQGGAARYK